MSSREELNFVFSEMLDTVDYSTLRCLRGYLVWVTASLPRSHRLVPPAMRPTKSCVYSPKISSIPLLICPIGHVISAHATSGSAEG